MLLRFCSNLQTIHFNMQTWYACILLICCEYTNHIKDVFYCRSRSRILDPESKRRKDNEHQPKDGRNCIYLPIKLVLRGKQLSFCYYYMICNPIRLDVLNKPECKPNEWTFSTTTPMMSCEATYLLAFLMLSFEDLLGRRRFAPEPPG